MIKVLLKLVFWAFIALIALLYVALAFIALIALLYVALFHSPYL